MLGRKNSKQAQGVGALCSGSEQARGWNRARDRMSQGFTSCVREEGRGILWHEALPLDSQLYNFLVVLIGQVIEFLWALKMGLTGLINTSCF